MEPDRIRPAPGSHKAQTLWHLRQIRPRVNDASRPVEHAPFFAALEESWPNNIVWCSKPPRDVEQRLIIDTNLSANARQGRWTED